MHDIALIELETELDLSGPFVRPVCLQGPDYEFTGRNGNSLECYVTGWGALGRYL